MYRSYFVWISGVILGVGLLLTLGSHIAPAQAQRNFLPQPLEQAGYVPAPSIPRTTCSNVSFSPAVSYTVGSGPENLRAADFNGDTILDLVTVNDGSNNISILLGNGDGSFQAQQTAVADRGPTSVATGDFNGDNHQDLAVSNFSTNNLSVLLGRGDGTFQPQVSYAAGIHPTDIATDDFNHDGHWDLVVSNYSEDGQYPHNATVSVFLGNADGTFQPQRQFFATYYPYGLEALTTGDLNNDGHVDIMLANRDGGAVSTLLGNGDGTFQTAHEINVVYQVMDVVAGDFNNDGHLDVASANTFTPTVSILLGDGSGTVQTGISMTTRSGSFGNTAGDFNNDGRLDVVNSNTGDASVAVLVGNGNGTFQAERTYAVGALPMGLTTGDFNRDGKLDLAVANYNSGSISVLLNNCVPAPTVTPTVTRTSTPTATRTTTGTVAPTVTRTAVPTASPTTTGTVAPTVTRTAVPTASSTATGTSTPPVVLTGTPTACAITFGDVTSADWFYNYVEWAACRGIIGGYSDGTFRPQNSASRGQVAKMITLATGWPLTLPAGAPHFGDVSPGSTFYTYIEVAWAHDIIAGYADGTFKPANPVTRAQLTKMVVLAYGLALVTPASPTFGDVAPGDWSYPYIETAAAHGIVGGYADGTFHPGARSTRAQFTKILYQAAAIAR